MAQYLPNGIRSLDKAHRSASEAHMLAEQPELLHKPWSLHQSLGQFASPSRPCSKASSSRSKSTTCSSSQRSDSCSSQGSETSSIKSLERRYRSVSEAHLAAEYPELNDEVTFTMQQMGRFSRPASKNGSTNSSRASSRSSSRTQPTGLSDPYALPRVPKKEKKKQLSDSTLAMLGQFGESRPLTGIWRPEDLKHKTQLREDGLPLCPRARSQVVLDKLGGMFA
eukprot:TRINITY_DN111410_c0_g1_i1.p1 TRINITY_DN111410_c0_g1~~TRINITY_DN111410_c0_g1_i1.p1  ORF type:complete len:224 (-),score=39.44 TRINITY_DN111410_c0_g1_i1:673-1344(-)